ncbi:MAG: hypothetical protein ACXWQE_00215 [Bdellovibrionales bacterium]
MELNICADSEDVQALLEYYPPPTFFKLQYALDWADENLPVGTEYEVIGFGGRVLFQGNSIKKITH